MDLWVHGCVLWSSPPFILCASLTFLYRLWLVSPCIIRSIDLSIWNINKVLEVGFLHNIEWGSNIVVCGIKICLFFQEFDHLVLSIFIAYKNCFLKLLFIFFSFLFLFGLIFIRLRSVSRRLRWWLVLIHCRWSMEGGLIATLLLLEFRDLDLQLLSMVNRYFLFFLIAYCSSYICFSCLDFIQLV